MKNEIDAKELGAGMTMTLHIKRYKQWQWRVWIAAKLFRLACWIGWFNYAGIEELEDVWENAVEHIVDEGVWKRPLELEEEGK